MSDQGFTAADVAAYKEHEKMIGKEPEPLPESIQFNGRNAQQVVDWARETSAHYERNDSISASGMDHTGADQFTLRINDTFFAPQPGEKLHFSDRSREFDYAPQGQDNPWPRDHPMTPAENKVLYQVSSSHGLPAGTVPQGVLAAKQNALVGQQEASMARHPSATGKPGVRHPVQPVRTPQFGEVKPVTNLTNRIGKKG